MTEKKSMTKKETIAAAMKLPELPEVLYHNLTSSSWAFQTGSRVYEDPSQAADEDWCVLEPAHIYGRYTTESDHDYADDGGFNSVYGNYQGRLINIICFNDLNLWKAWKKATETLQAFRHSDLHCKILGVKWKRVRLFRAFVDVYRTDPTKTDKLSTPVLLADAYARRICARCGREAVNFTNQAAYLYWEETGTCERCTNI